MLGSHMGDRAVVLADLHAVAHGGHRGGVTMRVEHLGEVTCYLRYRFIIGHQGLHVLHEAFEPCLRKTAHGLRPTGFPKRGECFGSELVVGVAKLGTALICEAEVLSWAATTSRMPWAGRRTAVNHLGESFFHQNV